MKNAYTGTVIIEAGGGQVPVRFDWQAIAALRSEYGKAWEGEVQRIMAELDSEGLAKILGLASPHDAAWWMAASPPFVPTAHAVQEALQLAFFGAGGLDEKKTTRNRLTTLLSLLGKSGSNSAAGPTTSGS